MLDTLVYLRQKTTVWLELTTLLIPGANDSDEELTAMSKAARQVAEERADWDNNFPNLLEAYDVVLKQA